MWANDLQLGGFLRIMMKLLAWTFWEQSVPSLNSSFRSVAKLKKNAFKVTEYKVSNLHAASTGDYFTGNTLVSECDVICNT